MTSPPALAHSREELRSALRAVPAGRVGFVPTMGALHEGHAELMRTARREVTAAGPVVVSIFVNPLQFGAGEDLERYPRSLEEDLLICEKEGADIVFAPSVEEVYPGGVPTSPADQGVTVEPGPLAGVLEGVSRPTHFRGVLTVVAKLFGLVRPDVAVFGQKDYQQLALIRQMVADLCMGVDVVGSETVREHDGLALSSRNRYLDPAERQQASVLSRALFAARAAARDGAEAALGAARAELDGSGGVDLDYLEITAPDLGPAPSGGGAARMLVAARFGSTRLIDNVELRLGLPEQSNRGDS